MQCKDKIYAALKDAPPGWRYCRALNKRSLYDEDQYAKENEFTLEQVLEMEGNGVGVLLGGHSKATIKGKNYGLGAVDFDGDGSDITFKHHLGIDAKSLPKTVEVTSGKKNYKQLFFWIPEDYQHKLGTHKIRLEGHTHFELRYGNAYSMVAGAHDETPGYFWVNSPADTDIAIAPLL